MNKLKKGRRKKKTPKNNALRQRAARGRGGQRRVEKNRDKRCKGRNERARRMTVYGSVCHSRFRLAARFEESEKGIKKVKASGANKQLGGDAGSYWCLESAVVRCQCGGKTKIGQEYRWHKNIQKTFFWGVCVCIHICREQTLRSQLGDQADVA